MQRLLWASTGTKNPNYPELVYVEPLIAPETINTMPDQTIAAFLDHGTVAETAEQGVEDAVQVMGALNRLGVDFDYVATQLENQGIQKFIEPYEALMRHCRWAPRLNLTRVRTTAAVTDRMTRPAKLCSMPRPTGSD